MVSAACDDAFVKVHPTGIERPGGSVELPRPDPSHGVVSSFSGVLHHL